MRIGRPSGGSFGEFRALGVGGPDSPRGGRGQGPWRGTMRGRRDCSKGQLQTGLGTIMKATLLPLTALSLAVAGCSGKSDDTAASAAATDTAMADSATPAASG